MKSDGQIQRLIWVEYIIERLQPRWRNDVAIELAVPDVRVHSVLRFELVGRGR